MCCVSLKALLYQFIAQSPNASLQISQITSQKLQYCDSFLSKKLAVFKESHYCFGMKVVLNM